MDIFTGSIWVKSTKHSSKELNENRGVCGVHQQDTASLTSHTAQACTHAYECSCKLVAKAAGSAGYDTILTIDVILSRMEIMMQHGVLYLITKVQMATVLFQF